MQKKTAKYSYEKNNPKFQRYYQKSYAQGTAPATNASQPGVVNLFVGSTMAANNGYGSVSFSTMRTNPTVTIYSYATSQTARISDANLNDLTASSGATTYIGDSRFAIYNGSGGTVTTSLSAVFHYTISAEL